MDEGFDSRRDRHLFGPGSKRILALGGSANSGISTAIFIAFLERVEEILSQRINQPTRLGDYFDLIGGTSFGAITAAGLALGYRGGELKDFVFKLIPFALKSTSLRMPGLQPKFDADALRSGIRDLVGDRALESSDLITGLCIILKRMDTGSPWIISNNPRAPYWEDGKDYIGNKSYPLVNLLRASAAAAHFFDPELLPIGTLRPEDIEPLNEPLLARLFQATMRTIGLSKPVTIDPNIYGLFVDGTLTPHGNPSLALLNMAILQPFRIRWPTGPERLTVCSIGAGRRRFQPPGGSLTGFATMAIAGLTTIVTDAEETVLAQMQYLGECPTPWGDSDTGISAEDSPQGGKMCRFLHYNIEFEPEWIKNTIGETLSPKDIARLQVLDDPNVLSDVYGLAQTVAKKQVKLEHFS